MAMLRQERDMFSRIMGMVMAVILLVTLGISSISWVTTVGSQRVRHNLVTEQQHFSRA